MSLMGRKVHAPQGKGNIKEKCGQASNPINVKESAKIAPNRYGCCRCRRSQRASFPHDRVHAYSISDAEYLRASVFLLSLTCIRRNTPALDSSCNPLLLLRLCRATGETVFKIERYLYGMLRIE